MRGVGADPGHAAGTAGGRAVGGAGSEGSAAGRMRGNSPPFLFD
jgi:hypothetical protein